ncbi:MAG TPA: DNA ligase D [Candidatus Limnocylindrales bacterium]|nr:DNA ligase D [Candidatus Limnocylindrales bacterium]
MPLEEYRRKRDFSKTPEPGGDPAAAAASAVRRRRFVVQRHRATRLHYDFRLELDGVLVSWAVPKGPTLDPKERRMAVHVEDHPLEYFDFEGVIPPKQYGAGDVIVWDWGTWEPEEETPDPGAAVRNGELKFVLHGEKLRGRFTIVRTSRRPGAAPRTAFEDDEGEQWLLIHKRDEYAQPGWDAEEHPQSVKSGRTNDEVKANAPAIWVSKAPADEAGIDLSAAREAPMPDYLEPMKATLGSRPFRDEDWLFEVKWDGYRVEAVVRDGEVRLYTRNGNDAETYFPRLLSPPRWIDAREAIVDGEVVALDEAGRPDFGLLQERITAYRSGRRADLVYQAFDLLYLDGRLLLDVPLEERKKLLRLVLRETGRVRYAAHIETEGRAFWEAAAAQRLEGIVAKHRRSRYEPGRRVQAWLKLKVRPEQELVVGGWTPGEGSARDLGAVVVGVYEDGRLRFSGKVGSGFDARDRRELRARLDALATDAPPFDPPPPADYRGRWGGDLANVRWVRPELVIRAELGGWSRDGLVRQSSYKGIQPDRDPLEVVRERAVDPERVDRTLERSLAAAPASTAGRSSTPAARRLPDRATPEELAALDALGNEGVWEVGGETLKLTNLDKVLFPPREGSDEPATTKRELIRYFTRIAPVLLPHLVDRPLNLHRYPNGAGGPGFWQKDMPDSAPKWLTIWHETGFREREDREANDHLVADRVATLAFLANLAAFEIHAWTSTIHDPWIPTFALIDIDPGPRTTWDETLTLSRLYRTALGHLGVRAYAKTTGSRGIQAWIPIVRGKYTYADTSAWVEKLSRAIGATVPDLVSWEWSKANRGGKARLDYTQNAAIKTLVAPYAVRPRPGAPVSMPIGWSELDDPALRSDRWTIRDAVERVEAIGDPFAAVQTDEQDLPAL